MDDPDEEDVSLTFDELEEQNFLCKSRFRGDDFSAKFRCRRPADNKFSVCVTCHGLVLIWTTTTQTNTSSSSFLFSGCKALYYQKFEGKTTATLTETLIENKHLRNYEYFAIILPHPHSFQEARAK